MDGQITLSEYLFTRLKQLSLESIHGVPGDYNLRALDSVKLAGLRWVGNANELSAGYAADGYARIKGIGALVTSFGPGELSCINAIAGAYAERVPVVHVVGTPPLAAQRDRAVLHHSLGDGNFRIFAEMAKMVTVSQANLDDPLKAPRLVDQTLRECLLQSLPVYIELPTDMATAMVQAPLNPIDLSLPNLNGVNSPNEDHIVDTLVDRIRIAKRALILVDGLTDRFGIRGEVVELVKAVGAPTLTTPFGKSIVPEDLINYQDVYYGSAGDPDHVAWVRDCDLVLHIGPLNSDINTFGYTTTLPRDSTITFTKISVVFGQEKARDVNVKRVIERVLNRFKEPSSSLPAFEPFPQHKEHPKNQLKQLEAPQDSAVVDQYSFWLYMSHFLRPGDVILTDTGTAFSGGLSLVLPEKTTLINSAIWLSIGYTVGAAQGASLAQNDLLRKGCSHPAGGRVILFEGDGSFQMTAQSVSDMIRNKLDCTIFILNNNGYTIERIIHGFNESYNDIQPWRYLDAPNFFGADLEDPSYPIQTLRACNWGELRAVLGRKDVSAGKGLVMVEVMMDVADAPVALKKLAASVSKRNLRKEN